MRVLLILAVAVVFVVALDGDHAEDGLVVHGEPDQRLVERHHELVRREAHRQHHHGHGRRGGGGIGGIKRLIKDKLRRKVRFIKRLFSKLGGLGGRRGHRRHRGHGRHRRRRGHGRRRGRGRRRGYRRRRGRGHRRQRGGYGHFH